MKHKYKGFTLIELLAVIVILTIIALIATPVVLGIIDNARKESFENSSLGVFKAAELYEAKNDFDKISEDGVNVTDSSLPLEHGDFTSGKIIRNESNEIELVNVTDGTYCAKGTKNNLVVIKGTCDQFDTTAPVNTSINIDTITSNSFRVIISSEDLESGIKSYQYSIDGTNYISKTSNNHTFTNLDLNKTYTVYVRVINNNNIETEIVTKDVATKDITSPTYSVDKTGWQQQKIVTITYPIRESGYIYDYSTDGGNNWTVVSTGTTANITFNENGAIIARIFDGTNYKTSSSYAVSGIDTTPPTSVSVNLLGKTTNTITVTASGIDAESGIIKYEFSIDGNSYINNATSASYVFSNVTSGNHIIKVRLTNGSGMVVESSELTVSPEDIVIPTYAVDKTGWQQQKIVTITYPTRQTGFVYQYSINGGTSWTTVSSGTTQAVTFNNNGSLIARIYDGTNYKTASTYTVSEVDSTVISSVAITGTVASDTWTNTNVTLSANVTPASTSSGYIYAWYKDGVLISGANSSTYLINSTSTGTYTVKVTTGAGNTKTSTGYIVKVDKVAPTVPTTPDLLSEHDTGSSSTDNITKWWYQVKVSGTAEANTIIHLRNLNVGNDLIATTSANASGYWEIPIDITQNAWSSIYVWSGDQAGNWTEQPTPLNVYADTTAPSVPSVTYNGGANTNTWKNNYNLTLSSTDATGIWKYQTDHNMDGTIDREIGSNFIPDNGYSTSTDRYRAVDTAGNTGGFTGTNYIHMDTVKPTHTSWWWGTATSSGASLYIQTSDSLSGINRVQCPTSTQTGGYANWHWFEAVWDAGANAYRCDITSSTFNHYGQNYATHLYIYDNAGNGGYYNQTSVYINPNVIYLADVVNVGDFVSYTGNNGCTNCDGTSVSCYGGYANTYNGWRVLSKTGSGASGTVTLVSAGTPVCTGSGTAASIDSKANLYLNTTYATSARSINCNDALPYSAAACTNYTTYVSNTMIMPGGFYYFATSTSPGGTVLWAIVESGRFNTNAGYTFGLRPVINLKAGLKKTSGSGTNASPYIMST